MKKTIEKINKKLIELRDAGVSRKDISDGYHSFDELYYHRMLLFSIICNQNKEIAWKSKLHDDGTMFQDNFIVGITTEEGQYTYHYHIDHWDMYNVEILERAPKYDGHMPQDIERLLTIHNKSISDVNKGFSALMDTHGNRRLKAPLAIVRTNDIKNIEVVRESNFLGTITKTSIKATLLPELQEEAVTLVELDYKVSEYTVNVYMQIISNLLVGVIDEEDYN